MRVSRDGTGGRCRLEGSASDALVLISIRTGPTDDLGLPVVADDHRHLLQVQSPVERTESRSDRPDPPGTWPVDGRVWSVEGVAGIEQLGYVWFFATAGLFLVRLLIDPMMVRRPLLEPNMSVGGLTFVGVSLFLFLMANVLTSSLTDTDLAGSKQVEQIVTQQEAPTEVDLATQAPGYPPLFWLPI